MQVEASAVEASPPGWWLLTKSPYGVMGGGPLVGVVVEEPAAGLLAVGPDLFSVLDAELPVPLPLLLPSGLVLGIRLPLEFGLNKNQRMIAAITITIANNNTEGFLLKFKLNFLGARTIFLFYRALGHLIISI